MNSNSSDKSSVSSSLSGVASPTTTTTSSLSGSYAQPSHHAATSPAQQQQQASLMLQHLRMGTPQAHGDTASDDDDAVVRRTLAAIAAMERDTALMTLFFQHIAQCPPHGPFRYYSAVTFVERARRRRRRRRAQQQQQQDSDAADGAVADGDDFAAVVTIPHVLALMERYYNTNHLCSWPLLYVPASVHSSDVDKLLHEQRRR